MPKPLLLTPYDAYTRRIYNILTSGQRIICRQHNQINTANSEPGKAKRHHFRNKHPEIFTNKSIKLEVYGIIN